MLQDGKTVTANISVGTDKYLISNANNISKFVIALAGIKLIFGLIFKYHPPVPSTADPIQARVMLDAGSDNNTSNPSGWNGLWMGRKIGSDHVIALRSWPIMFQVGDRWPLRFLGLTTARQGCKSHHYEYEKSNVDFPHNHSIRSKGIINVDELNYNKLKSIIGQ